MSNKANVARLVEELSRATKSLDNATNLDQYASRAFKLCDISLQLKAAEKAAS